MSGLGDEQGLKSKLKGERVGSKVKERCSLVHGLFHNELQLTWITTELRTGATSKSTLRLGRGKLQMELDCLFWVKVEKENTGLEDKL